MFYPVSYHNIKDGYGDGSDFGYGYCSNHGFGWDKVYGNSYSYYVNYCPRDDNGNGYGYGWMTPGIRR